MMRRAGLAGVHVDEGPNAVGHLPATDGRRDGAVLLAAHIDTVFPKGTDARVRREGNILRGPGCRDNLASVAAILAVALALYLDAKARMEERWLLARFPDYAGYRARTRRLFPWVL